MSNKSHRSTTPSWTRNGKQNPSEKSARDRKLWTIFGVAVLALLIAVVVISAVAGGSDDSNSGVDKTKIEETRAVDVMAGESLPYFDDTASVDEAIGLTAPQVSGSTLDGGLVSTVPENGNFKMIVFVAHWCPHCQREVPRLVNWAAGGEVPDNLDVMAVSTAVDETKGNYPPSEWLSDEGWKFPIMADDSAGTAATAFGLTSFPYFVVLSPEGEVLARNSGEIEMSALNAMLSSVMGSTN